MTSPAEHPDFCYSHLVVEQQGQLRCGECFHWFADAAALLSDFNDMVWDSEFAYLAKSDPAEVTFCPHCVHDF